MHSLKRVEITATALKAIWYYQVKLKILLLYDQQFYPWVYIIWHTCVHHVCPRPFCYVSQQSEARHDLTPTITRIKCDILIQSDTM